MAGRRFPLKFVTLVRTSTAIPMNKDALPILAPAIQAQVKVKALRQFLKFLRVLMKFLFKAAETLLALDQV
jgi:hypothetical protein